MLRLLTIACLLAAAAALSCPPPPCQRDQCQQLTYSDCPSGIGVDFCGCCPVCLRNEGENCGGIYEGSPKCGTGLECYKPPLKEDENFINQDGICRKL